MVEFEINLKLSEEPTDLQIKMLKKHYQNGCSINTFAHNAKLKLNFHIFELN